MPDRSASERWAPWALRGAWIAVLVVGGRALESADAPPAVVWVGVAGWVVGVAAMAVPAVSSLTAVRVVVPAAIAAAAVTWIAGAEVPDAAAMVGASAIAALIALSSPLGRSFVQASAYGDEDRHLLRPPLGYATAAVVAWAVWAGLTVGAGTALAVESWIAVAVLGALAIAAASLGAPRWHRLSRRWLVLVPAGVVIHDDVVLAETVMIRRQQITAIGLALADTDATDLTGPAAGHAIEITAREPVTVVLGAPPARPVHVTACLVAPSRPGQVLAASRRRRLPVGSVA